MHVNIYQAAVAKAASFARSIQEATFDGRAHSACLLLVGGVSNPCAAEVSQAAMGNARHLRKLFEDGAGTSAVGRQ